MFAKLAAVAIIVVAGCAPSPDASDVGDPPASASPLPSEAALDLTALPLTCGDDPTFPAQALDGPVIDEALDDGSAALRQHLSEASHEGLPATGWRRVADTAQALLFIAPGGETGWTQVVFRKGGGGLTADRWGSCRLRPAVPDGVTVAELNLDPGFPAPEATATEVHLLINESACASGASPAGRIVEPIVTTSENAVWVAVLVRMRSGAIQLCPGNPWFAVTVTLPEALGERELLDAGAVPPRPISN